MLTGAATGASKTAAPATKGITSSGMTVPGFLGLGAGVTGVGLAIFNAIKDTVGKDDSVTRNLALGPATYAAGGGVGFLLLSEKGGFTNARVVNGIRGGGIALVLGGVAGAVIGALPMIRNQHDTQSESNTLIQKPIPYEPAMPKAPAQLEGIRLADAKAVTTSGTSTRLAVYADPTTAVKSRVQSLAGAISQARASSQADVDDRSHAVIQTEDGALWIMRLSGDLDQVDGRNYSKDSKLSTNYSPAITKKTPALMAIAGVEERYVFPEEMDAAAQVPTVGEASPVVPKLPKPKEAK